MFRVMRFASTSVSSVRSHRGNGVGRGSSYSKMVMRMKSTDRDLSARSVLATDFFDRFWNDPFWFPTDLFILRTQESKLQNWYRPLVDVKETDDAVIVNAELPGMKKEDIKLEVDQEGYLELSGKKESRTETKNGERLVRVESRFGEFRRRIPLPEDVEVDKISAKYIDGVLEVTIPKPQSAPKRERSTIPIE